MSELQSIDQSEGLSVGFQQPTVRVPNYASQDYTRYEELGIVMDNSTFAPEQDPSLIQAARLIYETYYTVHPEVTDLPLGVAINRFTYRGKLIFKRKPILLPQECFIPFNVIDGRK